MRLDYFKHLLIRTPIEPAAHELMHLLSLPKRLRHPGLAAVYEEPGWVERGCRRRIHTRSNCIDVGAHLGSQLSLFTRLAPAGSHMAFEPVPHKAAWLRKKFPEVEVHEEALSDQRGQVSFFVNTTRPGYSGLREHAEGGDKLERITVEQRTLDEVVGNDRRVDFLKIDVEGGELGVLKGATGILKRWAPSILFESTRSGLAATQTTPEQLFDFLSEHHYKVFLPKTVAIGDAGPLSRDAFAQAHIFPFRAFNFFAMEAH